MQILDRQYIMDLITHLEKEIHLRWKLCETCLIKMKELENFLFASLGLQQHTTYGLIILIDLTVL